MSEYRRYTGLIGWCLLALIVIVLGTSTGDLRVGSSYIDTEPRQLSPHARPVLTRMNLGDAGQLSTLPREIGDWAGFDYPTAELTESLEADVILMRGYTKPGLFQPMFLLLMHSRSQSSFHSPISCYKNLNFQIEEEGIEPVHITDTSWAEKDPRKGKALVELESPYIGDTLSVKKLILFREADGKIVERRVVLYFYIKEGISDKVSMVRVSALAPVSDSYDGVIEPVKELMNEVVPYLFEPRTEGRMLIGVLADRGAAGYIILILLFSVPLGLIVYSWLWARKVAGTRKDTE